MSGNIGWSKALAVHIRHGPSGHGAHFASSAAAPFPSASFSPFFCFPAKYESKSSSRFADCRPVSLGQCSSTAWSRRRGENTGRYLLLHHFGRTSGALPPADSPSPVEGKSGEVCVGICFCEAVLPSLDIHPSLCRVALASSACRLQRWSGEPTSISSSLGLIGFGATYRPCPCRPCGLCRPFHPPFPFPFPSLHGVRRVGSCCSRASIGCCTALRRLIPSWRQTQGANDAHESTHASLDVQWTEPARIFLGFLFCATIVVFKPIPTTVSGARQARIQMKYFVYGVAAPGEQRHRTGTKPGLPRHWKWGTLKTRVGKCKTTDRAKCQRAKQLRAFGTLLFDLGYTLQVLRPLQEALQASGDNAFAVSIHCGMDRMVAVATVWHS